MYIRDTTLLSDLHIANIFSKSVACCCILLTVSFKKVEVLNFDEVQSIKYAFMDRPLRYGITSKKSLPQSQGFSPIFFSVEVI